MSEIDWSRPIEAVHPDGRVVAVLLSDKDCPNPDADGDYVTEPVLEDGSNLWNANGINWSGGPWRIRNVAQPVPERDPALWDRMEALTRRIAKGFYLHAVNEEGIGTTDAVVVAQRIVVDLPKPVDPVEAIVDELMRKDCTTRQAIEEAVQRGRALAAQDAARG